MAKRALTHLERALRLLAQTPASHKEIVEHLLKRDGKTYNSKTRRHYDRLFYGRGMTLASVGAGSINGLWALPHASSYWK